MAVAHQQVCLLHQVLATGKPYEDPGEAYRNERQQRALERRLVRGLTSLGYRVELHPEPAAA